MDYKHSLIAYIEKYIANSQESYNANKTIDRSTYIDIIECVERLTSKDFEIEENFKFFYEKFENRQDKKEIQERFNENKIPLDLYNL